MRMLLTSAGITNPSLHAALVGLLTKPIAESVALVIPTASYAMPGGGKNAYQLIAGQEPQTPMCELGWGSLGVLELTALPSCDPEHWLPMLRDADVLLVGGGDPMYLCHWMRESGVAELLPTLTETVYVGLSAGSMVLTPRIGEDFVRWRAPGLVDETLGLVDFSIFPHLDHPELTENTMAAAEQWAGQLAGPSYALDDQTGIRVVDGSVEVVSEGKWKAFARD